ncbi:MAG: hypothetical protein KKE23_02325 [Nanoarchaeota archaeon]|nr:hypothetical protein [Nanoarchaeota archaeon]
MVDLEKHIDEIVRLYVVKKKGCALIGKGYGAKRYAIGKILRNRGIELKKRGKYSEMNRLTDWKKEYELHPEWKGKNSSQIAYETESGLLNFYRAFRKWVQKNIKDENLRKRSSCEVLGLRENLTQERIDQRFFDLYKSLDRIPTVREVGAACGGVMTAIFRGEYFKSITTYLGYLRHHGLYDPSEEKDLTREEMKAEFYKCKKKLGRDPLRKEIFHSCPGFERALKNERYSRGVNNYRKFMISIGEKANHVERNYWKGHPRRIIRAYWTEKKLNKNLKRKDFAARCSGAWDVIQNGEFKKGITTWNGFKRYLGEEIKYPHDRTWSPEKVLKAYYDQKKELGRNPTCKEFIARNGGAINTIRRRTYDPSISTYNGFLISLGEKVMRKISLKKGKDVWTKEDFIDAYTFLERERGRKPPRDMFMNYYGQEPFKQMKKRKIDGVRNWGDLERIVNSTQR